MKKYRGPCGSVREISVHRHNRALSTTLCAMHQYFVQLTHTFEVQKTVLPAGALKISVVPKSVSVTYPLSRILIFPIPYPGSLIQILDVFQDSAESSFFYTIRTKLNSIPLSLRLS
jgi:hypothetical protein